MNDDHTCPECRQGKHANCDGGSWDLENDVPAICGCWLAGHKRIDDYDSVHG